MKFIYFTLILLVTSIVSAQDINQFDTEGKRHGIWKKTFENTQVLRYEGEFFHGKEIGLFKFYKHIKNKAVLTATKQFNESNNKSYVKFFTSRGKVISEGEMNGKTYIGEWKYYQSRNDKLLILEYFDENGILDGERIVYYDNGQIAEKQFYKTGKLEGESVWYSVNNVVLKQYIYVNGELHGLAKFFNPKGELISEGQYKKDKKHGIWKYYENGELIDEKDFTYKPKYIKKS